MGTTQSAVNFSSLKKCVDKRNVLKFCFLSVKTREIFKFILLGSLEMQPCWKGLRYLTTENAGVQNCQGACS